MGIAVYFLITPSSSVSARRMSMYLRFRISVARHTFRHEYGSADWRCRRQVSSASMSAGQHKNGRRRPTMSFVIVLFHYYHSRRAYRSMHCPPLWYLFRVIYRRNRDVDIIFPPTGRVIVSIRFHWRIRFPHVTRPYRYHRTSMGRRSLPVSPTSIVMKWAISDGITVQRPHHFPGVDGGTSGASEIRQRGESGHEEASCHK